MLLYILIIIRQNFALAKIPHQRLAFAKYVPVLIKLLIKKDICMLMPMMTWCMSVECV